MVTIIIISFNSFATIKNCLSTLIQDNKFRTIIIDNASTDNSIKNLQINFPQAEVVSLPTNIGYGRGANVGLNMVKTEYALLLNPDIIIDSKTVTTLVDGYSKTDKSTALLAPAVKRQDHRSAGIINVPWVIGAAMLFNMQKLRKVGFFDDNIFLFSEESDLCLRILKAGYNISLNTDIYIEHLYKQSSTPSPEIDFMKNWHFGWSRMYFYHKHNLATGKKNPYRVICLTLYKYLTTTGIRKIEFKAKLLGTIAFTKGERAFNDKGNPQKFIVKK